MEQLAEATRPIAPRDSTQAGLSSWLQRHWWSVLFTVLLLLLLYLVGIPLVALLVSSFTESGLPTQLSFTLRHYDSVFRNPRTYQLIGTSMLFSVGSVLVALLFAAPIAWFVERTTMPHKNLIRMIMFAKTALPSVLLAMSWVLLASPQIGAINTTIRFVFGADAPTLNIYSFPGMVFVQGIAMAPLIFIMLSPVLRNMDSSYEEAALAAGTSLPRVILTISFPLILPALMAVVLYGLIIGLLTFEIPAVLGIPSRIFVFSSEIYFSTNEFAVPRYGQVSALSMVTLVVALLIGLVYMRVIGSRDRFTTMTGKFRPGQLEVGRAQLIAYGLLGLYLMLSLVLPFGVLIWTSLMPFFGEVRLEQVSQISLNNYLAVLTAPSGGAALRNTAINSTIVATVGTLLAALIAWVVMKSPLSQRRWLDLLALAPLVIPGIILGLSLRYVYLTFTFIPIYGTIWILTIAHLTDGLPFGTRSANSALAQIHPELEEAGLTSGRSWWETFRTITLPLAAPSLVFIWLWTLLHAIRELSASVMLYSPRSPVISTLLWQLWDASDLATGAAVGTLLFLVLFVITIVALRILERARANAGLV